MGLVGAALAYGHVAHEAFFFELLHVADLDRKARRVFGDGLGVFNKGGGVEVRGAGVDQVPCERDGLLFYSHFFGNLLECCSVFACHNLEGYLEILLLLALVGVELVVGVMEPVKDCLELFIGGVG